MAKDQDWHELPFREAIEYLRSLAPMSALDIEYYAEAAASRAFFVTRVYKLNVLQAMLDAFASALEGGVTMEDFIADFAATGLSEAHLATVFKTNLQTFYGRGNWEQGNDSDISDFIWGWRYRTQGDDRVREEHEILEGLVFAKGDGDEFFPPIGFDCRCTGEWITEREAEADGLTTSTVPKEARSIFEDTDFVSPALRDEFDPDLGQYDLGLVREYLAEEGASE